MKTGFEYELKNTRGWIGVGIYNPKLMANVSMLARTCFVFGVDYMFTIGDRYKRTHADTTFTQQHLPIMNYKDWKDFMDHKPLSANLIGAELHEKAHPIGNFVYPKNGTIIILGAEDSGLPENVLNSCNDIIKLPGHISLNVGIAGSIIIHDYFNKRNK